MDTVVLRDEKREWKQEKSSHRSDVKIINSNITSRGKCNYYIRKKVTKGVTMQQQYK